jgi:hypothetical protein
MLLVRYRIGVMEDWLGSGELDVALLERQAEGAGAQPLAVDPEVHADVHPVADPAPDPDVDPEADRAVPASVTAHGTDAHDGAGLPLPETAR